MVKSTVQYRLQVLPGARTTTRRLVRVAPAKSSTLTQPITVTVEPMALEADGVDVSGIGQGAAFDWDAVAACTTKQFGAARISHGAYTDAQGAVHAGFIDSSAARNRTEMLRTRVERRCWYTLVTPLEDAVTQADRTRRWVGLNGGLPPGECIAIDWESNPNNGEIADEPLVWALYEELAGTYGPDRVGFYVTAGLADQLRSWDVGFRWVANWTANARQVCVEKLGCVVQWSSGFQCPGWPGRLDINEVVDAARLDRACGIGVDVTLSGSLDLVEYHPTGIRVSGWAYDSDHPAAPAVIRVGTQTWDVPKTFERADVNAALGITGNHGFTSDLSGSVPLVVSLDGDATPTTISVPIGGTTPPPDPQPGGDGVDEARCRAIAREEISAATITVGSTATITPGG